MNRMVVGLIVVAVSGVGVVTSRRGYGIFKNEADGCVRTVFVP